MPKPSCTEVSISTHGTVCLCTRKLAIKLRTAVATWLAVVHADVFVR